MGTTIPKKEPRLINRHLPEGSLTRMDEFQQKDHKDRQEREEIDHILAPFLAGTLTGFLVLPQIIKKIFLRRLRDEDDQRPSYRQKRRKRKQKGFDQAVNKREK